MNNGGVIVRGIIGDIGVIMRGDVNSDGVLSITDPVQILDFLFRHVSAPSCPAAADANFDGTVNITDPILLLGFLFLGTAEWQPTPVQVGGSLDPVEGCR